MYVQPDRPELHALRRQCSRVIEWPRWREFLNRAIAEHQAASDRPQGIFHGANMGAVVRIAQLAHRAFAKPRRSAKATLEMPWRRMAV